jgi:hypothetical protein
MPARYDGFESFPEHPALRLVSADLPERRGSHGNELQKAGGSIRSTRNDEIDRNGETRVVFVSILMERLAKHLIEILQDDEGRLRGAATDFGSASREREWSRFGRIKPELHKT